MASRAKRSRPNGASVDGLVARLDELLDAMPAGTTSCARQVRRTMSREVPDDPSLVQRFADVLVDRDGPWDRYIAYELLNSRLPVIRALSETAIRRLGRGIDSWGDVDMFACFVAGPAWREGRVTNAEVLKWTRSRDRWWRRAAVVATVPLNSRARGGSGDAARTFKACSALLDDRDPMIVKAVSWALRELAKRDANGVRAYLEANDARLAPLVRREVNAKLTTGLKNPGRNRRTSRPT